MPTLPTSWRVASQLLHQTAVWAWLWQIVADRATGGRTVFRITAQPTTIVYAGMTFYPVPMTQSAIGENAEGDLPQATLVVDNSSRFMRGYFSVGAGFMGQEVLGWLVNLSDLTQAAQFRFTVAGASVTEEQAEFRLERLNLSKFMLPQQRYSAQVCRWVFGSSECGYVLNAAAAYQTCPRTLGACSARGIDMQNRNLPKLQPGRFGGFPGISET